jgi:hypothetical protein
LFSRGVRRPEPARPFRARGILRRTAICGAGFHIAVFELSYLERDGWKSDAILEQLVGRLSLEPAVSRELEHWADARITDSQCGPLGIANESQ